MEAKEILNMLLKRHTEWVCVPECKSGATWGKGASHRRIDLWVMKKSWSDPRTIGYEIKVSRSDFINDTKWRDYLPYCSEFYFAAPKGIIEPSELPEEAGLVIPASTGSMVYVKKKAPLRKVDIPEDLFRYILMWRAEIIADQNSSSSKRAERAAWWAAWLEKREQYRRTGHMVSRRLQEQYEENVFCAAEENRTLKREVSQLEDVRDMLHEMGVTDEDIQRGWGSVKATVKAELDARGHIPDEIGRYAENALRAIKLIQKAVGD